MSKPWDKVLVYGPGEPGEDVELELVLEQCMVDLPGAAVAGRRPAVVRGLDVGAHQCDPDPEAEPDPAPAGTFSSKMACRAPGCP